MKFYSTRNKDLRCSLKEAAIMGLAPDGGLFMPETIPSVDLDKAMSYGTFPEMAAYLASFFFDEYSCEELLEMTSRAFSFDVPLAQVGPGLQTLELFHGPTFAFKDVGAGFMGQMMGRLAGQADQCHCRHFRRHRQRRGQWLLQGERCQCDRTLSEREGQPFPGESDDDSGREHPCRGCGRVFR